MGIGSRLRAILYSWLCRIGSLGVVFEYIPRMADSSDQVLGRVAFGCCSCVRCRPAGEYPWAAEPQRVLPLGREEPRSLNAAPTGTICAWRSDTNSGWEWYKHVAVHVSDRLPFQRVAPCERGSECAGESVELVLQMTALVRSAMNLVYLCSVFVYTRTQNIIVE